MVCWVQLLPTKFRGWEERVLLSGKWHRDDSQCGPVATPEARGKMTSQRPFGHHVGI